MKDAWLGIDLGTQSIRAVVLDSDGGRLAIASAPLVSRRSDGRHEQDPNAWLTVTWALLQQVTADLDSTTRIRALCVSGTSGTIVPLDAQGRPSGLAAMYDDRRGADRLPEVLEHGAALWARLGYRMQATWGLPKLLAMRETADPGTVFGHQPDVVTAALAGHRLPSDLSSALKTGADLDAVSWPADVFDRLDLPVESLNTVADSGTVIGTVSAEAAGATGLPAGCAIVAGMTDGCAAQLAAGAITPGSWNSVLGTTLVLKGVSDQRHVDPNGVVYAHRAPFDGGWYPGGASSTGARAISAMLPGRDLRKLTAEAARLDGVPVAYPLVGRGERFPFVADTAEPFWPANSGTMTDAALLRAIAFGNAFVERLSFELLAAVGYDRTDVVYLTGGAARNTWWNSIRAQVLDRPVAVAADTEGASGMALLAAAAHMPTHDAKRLHATAVDMLTPGVPVDPATEPQAEIDDAYGVFVAKLLEAGYLDSRIEPAS